MIVRHWVSLNNSGMHHAARDMSAGDRACGHDSHLCDPNRPETWAHALSGADVHVAHTDFPLAVRKVYPNTPVIFVGHGTPEVMVMEAVDCQAVPGYAPADGWMLTRHWLRTADAVVAFHERHADLYRRILGRNGADAVHVVPLGVDRAFWAGGEKVAKYRGAPSVWTSENPHRIKWPLDALIAWPHVLEAIPEACLHAHYITLNLHRFFIDLANSNGAAIGAVLSPATWDHRVLRSIWTGLDFFLGLVAKGDLNCLSMQAAAAGMKTISYRGNPYADFWVTEGDQRAIAAELVAIFRGEVEPRGNKLPVPDVADMGRAMSAIYERVLNARARVAAIGAGIISAPADSSASVGSVTDTGTGPHPGPDPSVLSVVAPSHAARGGLARVPKARRGNRGRATAKPRAHRRPAKTARGKGRRRSR